MQPRYQLIRSGLAYSLLATVALRSAEPDAAKAPPSPAPVKAPGADPFVKGDDPARANAGGTHPGTPPPSAVFVQEVYALKKEDAFMVLEDATSGADRYQRVLALERDNKAHLLTLDALTNKSGQKATLEGVDHVRYATSFRRPTDAMPKGSVLPTNFEQRNAGDTWEMVAVFLEGGGGGGGLRFLKRTCRLERIYPLSGLARRPGRGTAQIQPANAGSQRALPAG